MGDSIVRKTALNKCDDVVVCFSLLRIEDVTERVEKVLGLGKGWSILGHVGTNDKEKEGTTAIVQKHRQLVRTLKPAWVGQIIMAGILPVMRSRRHNWRAGSKMHSVHFDKK